MTTNILVLAAARTSLSKRPDRFPVCLSEIENRNILEWIVQSTANIADKRYVFCFLRSENTQFHLELVARQVAPGCQVDLVPELTDGSGCTALLSASKMDPDSPLLVVSANEVVKLDLNSAIEDMRRRDLDAGTVTFEATHPRYSYVFVNEEGLIEEAAQHRPISRTATTGIFWFRRAGDFVEGLKSMILKQAAINGTYYLAPVFNELILKQGRVGTYPIAQNAYVPVKENLISSGAREAEQE